MQHPDPETHSFVIKLWLEETVAESRRGIWRGRITHVGSGKRYYITALSSIARIIAPYLEAMQVDLGIWWKARRWLEQVGCALAKRAGGGRQEGERQ
jgi:hypothetical protein